MNQWTNDRIDQEMMQSIDDVPEGNNQDQSIEKRIESRMKKQIRKIVNKTLGVTLVIVILLLAVINPILNAAFLNSMKLNADGQGVMYQTLKDYFEVTRPYAELCSLSVKGKGFAQYELQMQFVNRREPVHLGIANTWVDVEFNKYKDWKDVNRYSEYLMNRFDYALEDKEKLLQNISELPASAVVYLSIGEKDARPVSELIHENINAIWAQIDQPNVDFQGGIALQQSIVYEDIDFKDMTEAQQKQLYLSKLSNLIENKKVWSSLAILSDNKQFYDIDVLSQCYDDAQNMERLMTKKYCISGKRDEILAYLQSREIQSLYVDEVKLCQI